VTGEELGEHDCPPGKEQGDGDRRHALADQRRFAAARLELLHSELSGLRGSHRYLSFWVGQRVDEASPGFLRAG
jgi:hypothetical protein